MDINYVTVEAEDEAHRAEQAAQQHHARLVDTHDAPALLYDHRQGQDQGNE